MVGALIGMGLMSVSCNDELDLYPEDYFSGNSFWNSQTEFEGFITVISNQFRSNYPANILFYAGELRAGGFELVTIDGSGSLNTNVIQNIYDETNCQFSTFGGYYGFIPTLTNSYTDAPKRRSLRTKRRTDCWLWPMDGGHTFTSRCTACTEGAFCAWNPMSSSANTMPRNFTREGLRRRKRSHK